MPGDNDPPTISTAAQRLEQRQRIQGLIAKAFDDADQTMALVERRARDERRTRIAEVERGRDAVRGCAREVEDSCLRAVEALAIATQKLASASAHAPAVALPSWPEAVPQPIEVRMDEIRELTLRMSGPRMPGPMGLRTQPEGGNRSPDYDRPR